MALRNLPHLAYNWISGIGAVLASVAFLAAVILLIFSIFAGLSGPYLGIVIYVFLPPVVIFGLLLIPLGMWLKSRRLKRGEREEELPNWPHIDLNDRRQRNGAFVFAAGSTAFVLASMVGLYETYRYTESVAFCGRLCHTVMNPEYVTHQISPHAHVTCTECHVGPGAGWYAKSKMRGLNQVYEVFTRSYPKPIPIPISDLRPTELECHRCHWPENFFGGRDWRFHNYMYDEQNTYWPVHMVIRIGGGDPAVDQTGGIHWFMNIGYKLEYIARDARRQDIPWVRVTNRQTGKVTVYQDQSNPLTRERIASSEPRTMDCVDCHNSPTHIFHTPDSAINLALYTGRMPDLPYVKKTAVEALSQSYRDDQAALLGLPGYITSYYDKNPPNIYGDPVPEIMTAAESARKRYFENIFPAMNADWKAYPDNLGHFYYPGCFRCHLGNHKSESGETVNHDCSVCHTITLQGTGGRAETEKNTAGLAFEHPGNVGTLWSTMPCSDCHTGVQP